MNGLGVTDHGLIGAAYLRNELNLENDEIADLVGQHINAKRYLTFKKGEEYYKTLSDASKQTLVYQGGPMSQDEANEYEKTYNQEILEKITRLRKYDDLAKDKDAQTPDLNYFVPLLEKYF